MSKKARIKRQHKRCCWRKKQFPTEYRAQSMIASMKRRKDYDGLPLRAYECTECGQFHVGHATKPHERNQVMSTATLEPIPGPEQHSPEWLAIHKTHVTASRMAAILGASEYSTPLDEFLVMTGRKAPFEGNEHTRRGTRYEPVIVADYCESAGKTVEYPVPLFFHPQIEGLAASPDAIITPDRSGLVEAKWSMSPAIASQLGEEETDHIPTPWLLQAQTQMSVMGAEFVDFAVLLYGRLKVYHVEQHPELISTIESAAIEFLERVKNDDAPEADYEHEGARTALKILYGLKEDVQIDLDEPAAEIWAARQKAAADESAAKKAKEALDAQMLGIFRGAEVGWLPDGGKIKRAVVTVGEKVVKGYSFERFFYSKAKGR